MTDKKYKDRAIAALLTSLAALAILLLLLFGSISWDRRALAETPAPQLMKDDELFIEPELVELGEETADNSHKPAPTLKGEPAPAPDDNADIIDPGPKPEPKPKPVRNEITQKKESKLQQDEAAKTEKERKKATSSVADKFSSKNGSPDGADNGSSGAGGPGIGVSGNAHGRSFISCPKPDVALRHKTVVTVNVVIDAEGKVTEAKASGSASADIRRKCEAAARQARWSPKKGASSTRGSITFTITPR